MLVEEMTFKLIFTPHLVPMNRGILVTAYANLAKDVTYEDVKAAYDKYYDKEYFVRVLPKDVCPETRWVEGSNFVDIGFKIEPRTNRIIAMGALDNLVKGAAGQAVQNMNLLFGLMRTKDLRWHLYVSHNNKLLSKYFLIITFI